MSKTNIGLVEYAKCQLGKPYWYGTFGQKATISLLNSKKKQYPKYYRASDFKGQIGSKVFDCIGLIKGYLWSDTPTSDPKYNSEQDVSAKGMYAVSKVKGTISSFNKKNGTLVYKGRSTSSITHVGIYSNGYVYEAKGHAYGVVKTKFNSSWKYWSECPFIKYSDTHNKTNKDIANEVIQGIWGNGQERKDKLTAAGYNYREIQNIVKDILG